MLNLMKTQQVCYSLYITCVPSRQNFHLHAICRDTQRVFSRFSSSVRRRHVMYRNDFSQERTRTFQQVMTWLRKITQSLKFNRRKHSTFGETFLRSISVVKLYKSIRTRDRYLKYGLFHSAATYRGNLFHPSN